MNNTQRLLREIDAQIVKLKELHAAISAVDVLLGERKKKTHHKHVAPMPVKKRHISKAGRAAIGKAARKRWAAFHLAQRAKAKK
jgi:hypothetical protein